MQRHDVETTVKSKSHPSRQALERQTEVSDAHSILSPERDPLAQVSCRLGDASCAGAHASTLNHATASRPTRGAQSLLQLQRQYGNRYVQRVLALARKADGEAEAAPEVEASIQQARGSGQALDSRVRAQMESAFGADFGGVRVHTDAGADTLSRALSARAFTTGQDIFFRQGEYNPGTSSGRELLAHELTHVVQQAGSTVQGKLVIGQPGDMYEQEADRVTERVMQMPEPQVQRQPEEEEEESLQTKSMSAILGIRGQPVPAQPMIQRDLAIRPPRPEAVGRALSEAEMRDAIDFDERFLNSIPNSADVIRMIRDVLGVSRDPPNIDEDFVNAVVDWQAMNGLTQDGKLGPTSAAPLFREIGAEGVGQGRLKSGPTYTPGGTLAPTVAGGNESVTFRLNAEFDSDPANGIFPSCCEVRQSIRWDAAAAASFAAIRGPGNTVPHAGFPAGHPADTWIEDRDGTNTLRYGHRVGFSPGPGNQYLDSDGKRNQAFGHIYRGRDTPGGPVALAGQWRFMLRVIDVCNGGRRLGWDFIRINW